MSRKCELSNRKVRSAGQRKHRKGSSGSGGVWASKAPRTTTVKRPNLRSVKLVDPTGNKVTKKISMKVYKKLRQGIAIQGYRLANKLALKAA